MIAAAAARPGCVGQHAKVSVWCYGLRLDTFNLPEVPHFYVTNFPNIYRIKDRGDKHHCPSEVGNLHSAAPEFVLWLISNCALALSMALSRRSLNAFGAHSKSRLDGFPLRRTAAQLSSPWHHLNELLYKQDTVGKYIKLRLKCTPGIYPKRPQSHAM